MDDTNAVLDAAGVERAALLGTGTGGQVAMAFAATYPQRTTSLVLANAYARSPRAPDYPWGAPNELQRRLLDQYENWGGTDQIALLGPSVTDDSRVRDWWSRYQRLAASLGTAITWRRTSQGTLCRAGREFLATVLFTDIVGSTERVAEIGDCRWTDLLAEQDAVIRRQFDRFRGREVDASGDGFFAAFDEPARAIECACAIRDASQRRGLEIRAALHTGECEVREAGIAVHIGARVVAKAYPGEVLVSSTVKDLVAGLRFAIAVPTRSRAFQAEKRLFEVQQ
jgi:class 3 adenylate cyclase